VKKLSKFTETSIQDGWFLGSHWNCWPAEHKVVINSHPCWLIKSVAEQGKKIFKLIREQKSASPRIPLRWFRSGRDVVQLFCIYKFHCVRMVVPALSVPLQALTGPEGSRRLRLADFKTNGTWRWQGCQPYAPVAFTPRKYTWYSFLLETESTPGP
jgi:hypothetical protein